MDILFHVSTERGASLLLPLASACLRAGHAFGAFFTHDGVRGLHSVELQVVLRDAGDARVVVCKESWHRFCGEMPCPVKLGSQTLNSALMRQARRVVSL